MKDINDIYNGLRAPLKKTLKKDTREEGFRYIGNGFEFGEGLSTYPNYWCKFTVPTNTNSNILEVHFSDSNGGYRPPVRVQFQSTTLSLDTPYYATKMQQEGIYDDYVAYRDELHEYENSQTTDETMLLPVLQEPAIPDSVREFAEKYKLI